MLWNYLIPLAIFAYCYARIFHTIRRQSKVVTGHAGRGQAVATTTVTTVTTTTGNETSGQVQQQGTAAATGSKLSNTEMNVLKTMITVIVIFVVFWAPLSLATFLFLFEVSLYAYTFKNIIVDACNAETYRLLFLSKLATSTRTSHTIMMSDLHANAVEDLLTKHFSWDVPGSLLGSHR